MRRSRIAGLLGLALLLLGDRAGAVSIALVPSSTNVLTGQLVTVGVVVSGLGSFVPPTVSAFDLDVSFASPQLSFVDVVFGTGLGTGPAQVLTSDSLQPGAVVDFAAASLLSSATLDAQQPASFVLATLTFLAGTPGSSPLAILQAELADTSELPANQITVESLTGTSILVAVPEPSAALLLAIGIAGLAARRARIA